MAINIINSTVAELFLFYFCFVLLFSSPIEAKRKAIEEIPRRQLDTLITTEDYLAVFWQSKNCKTCDRILSQLETRNVELEEAGIKLVKLNDKKAAKTYGVLSSPGLTYFKGGEASNYEDDFADTEAIVDFLANPESMELPDKIEEVNGNQLEKLIKEKTFVAVFFYNPQQQSKDVLQELENIDGKADNVGIAFVKINDLELVDEYNLASVPAIVYFRYESPILYQGDLMDEGAVLEWLIENRSTGDEDDVIEDVDIKSLETMIQSVEQLAVLFYDPDSRKVDQLLETLENIDDDCSLRGIHFVKVASDENDESNDVFGIEKLPKLVYFEDNLPNMYEGNLLDAQSTLQWLLSQADDDSIEEVTGTMIDKLIKETKHLVVLFYRRNSEESLATIELLETVDDELTAHGVNMVKTSDLVVAEEYGVDEVIPEIVYFENGIPSLYPDSLDDASEVSKWLISQVEGDHIEDVTDEMLDKLVSGDNPGVSSTFSQHQDVAVLFYDKDEAESEAVVQALEHIDDDCDRVGIMLVKIDDTVTAQEYGVEDTPALVYFENEIPHLYEGELSNSNEVLGWLIHQMKNDEIEEVTDEMLKMLVEDNPHVAVLFYDKNDKLSEKILTGLETIDDETDASDVLLVKVSEIQEAREEFGDSVVGDELPSLVFFDDKVPTRFEGDLLEESEVLQWLKDEREDQDEDTSTAGEEVNETPKAKPETPKTAARSPKKSSTSAVDKTPESKPNKKPASTKSKSDPAPTSDIKKGKKPVVSPETEPKKPVKVIKTEKFVEHKTVPEAKLGSRQQPPAKNDTDEDEEDNEDEPEMSSDDLIRTVAEKSNVVTFFYDKMDKIATRILSGIQRVETQHFEGKDLLFLNMNGNGITDIPIPTLPSLVYFKNGDPEIYQDNLMNEAMISTWIKDEFESNKDVIEDLSAAQVAHVLENEQFVMVYVYSETDCDICDETITSLEEIDDDAEAVGVRVIKTDDEEFADEYGITEFPAIVYFETGDPSIYDGDPREESELLTWLLYQMKEDTMENINRDLLLKMVDKFEFLGVFFYTSNEDSDKMLRHLELIDDEASQYDVKLVKIDDPLMAKKYGHRDPPGLGYFRKGNYIKYDGDEFDDEEMLDWLTDPNIMEVSDQIEKVNRKMFEKLTKRNDHMAVFFYTEEDCKQCDTVLQELENIDDEAEEAGIPIVKLEDTALAKEVGLFAFPSIVFFRNFGKEAVIYAGDIKNEDSILEWLLVQMDPSNEAIEDAEGEELESAIENYDSIAVFIYSQDDCETCLDVLQGLENIDDDAERQDVHLVKTTDTDFAEKMGIEADEIPSIIYFNEQMPNLFDGDISAEEEVLDWLIEQNVESHIDLVTKPMLEEMIEEIQYLVVFFFKQNCRTCDQVLAEIENIDDECDAYGIHMVRINDPPLAKRYGIKTYPSIVYFRNGNPLTYDGDQKDENAVLEWLLDADNRELDDAIEMVNEKMLVKLLEKTQFMAVFFYDEDCLECESVLEALEEIDDEADMYGIDFVKSDDEHTAKTVGGVFSSPSLVYFRKGIPLVYDGGDLTDSQKVLSWLTSEDVFSTGDEIEDVNRHMLDKLLNEDDFVAVFFYSNVCPSCNKVLEGLESIDDETDALDITFVKINDPRYAKKYGVNKIPALVYFRKKFPSIYRDDLLDETEILTWLRSNRYKKVELDWIMYTVLSAAFAFLMYSAFIIYGLKPKEVEKKLEDE